MSERILDREEAIDVLIAEREITRAMMRYCRGIDRRDEALVRSAYHDDAIDDHGPSGVASAVEFSARVNPDHPNAFPAAWTMTQHFLGNHLVEVDGDRAVSEWYFIARHRYAGETTDEDLLVAGRYLDRWERRGGPFKISHRVVTQDWVRTDPVTTLWPGPDHSLTKAHWGGPPVAGGSAHVGSPSADDLSYGFLG
jgi:hypothetical protein